MGLFEVQSTSYIGASIGFAVATIALLALPNAYTNIIRRAGKDLPPFAQEGFFSALSNFLGPGAHKWVVVTTKELNSKIFRLPITPPGFHFIVVADATVGRRILMNPETMKFKPFYKNLEKFTGGSSILTSEGFRYKHARKAIMPAFGRHSFHRMTTLATQIVDEWVNTKLQAVSENRESLDVVHELQRVTVQVISEIAFDYKMSDDQITDSIEALRVHLQEYLKDNILNPTREYVWFLYPKAKAAREARAFHLKHASAVLDAHRAKGDKAIKGIIIDTIDKNPDYVNDFDRLSDITLFIGAGFETTAGTLSWALYLLAKDNEYQTKLRDTLGSVSDEEGWQHQMLKYTIRETMRLYPATAVGIPKVVAEDILHDGIRVPKGSIVVIPPYAIHRDGDIFDKPNDFIPSRWENASIEMQQAYHPFSLGRRNCMGMALANIELQIVLATLVKKFEFTILEEGISSYNFTLLPVGLRMGITNAV